MRLPALASIFDAEPRRERQALVAQAQARHADQDQSLHQARVGGRAKHGDQSAK
jgi:hypothetical protein